ncbi:uncharacterized protein LOC134217033 [Armigeres subalbatus]|uniref:uncharacterized protein LOC134217033 n=1 Tax=Armigeres subalbatus TaxID=124917 RepID=UPI002ED667D7
MTKSIRYVISLQLYCIVQAAVTIVIDEEIHECGGGVPLPYVDISEVQIITQEDGTITVNGTTRFSEDYESPTKWKMYSKRMQRGQWVSGVVSREVWNLCPLLLSPTELWFPLMVKMQKNSCPFLKGYEEHMDMINLGNPGILLKIPPEFIGEWQMYHEFTTTRRGLSVKECFMSPISIMEV